jgi:hypothetical protein
VFALSAALAPPIVVEPFLSVSVPLLLSVSEPTVVEPLRICTTRAGASDNGERKAREMYKLIVEDVQGCPSDGS